MPKGNCWDTNHPMLNMSCLAHACMWSYDIVIMHAWDHGIDAMWWQILDYKIMGFVAAILRGKYIYQSEPPATGTPWWMNGRWTGNIFPLGSNSWVAHMEEEARQTAGWEADLPTISHKTWQVENPDLLLCCTAGRCLPATVAPRPARPQTVALCLALCLSLSGVSPIPFLLTCLSSIAMKTKWFCPHPFEKIRNIPWEHVCTTQLAHPFKN
jgi:hypothetical protein